MTKAVNYSPEDYLKKEVGGNTGKHNAFLPGKDMFVQ